MVLFTHRYTRIDEREYDYVSVVSPMRGGGGGDGSPIDPPCVTKHSNFHEAMIHELFASSTLAPRHTHMPTSAAG